jgi:hypothetical protein
MFVHFPCIATQKSLKEKNINNTIKQKTQTVKFALYIFYSTGIQVIFAFPLPECPISVPPVGLGKD